MLDIKEVVRISLKHPTIPNPQLTLTLVSKNCDF